MRDRLKPSVMSTEKRFSKFVDDWEELVVKLSGTGESDPWRDAWTRFGDWGGVASVGMAVAVAGERVV